MRLLLVTPFPPCRSAAHGGGAYLASLVDGLARRAELGLVSLTLHAGQPAAPAVPWAWLGLAAREDRPDGVARPSDRVRMLWRWRRSPLVAAKHASRRLEVLVRQAVTEWRPDAALVEMAQMAQYLPALRGVPTVFTDHEAGCPANTHTGLGRLGDARDRRLWHRYVQRFYSQADVLQALTAEDASSLSSQLARPVLVRPPTVVVPAEPVHPELAPGRALFLGDYQHAPNPEAAARLAHEVVPLVRRQQPDFVLRLAGAHSERVRALGELPGVEVVGFVPDLHALLASVRFVLSPVYSGDGVRMKNLVALAHGVPVVTNRLGARGNEAPPLACRLAETAPELAQQCLRLLCDPATAGTAGRSAHVWAKQHLDADAVAAHQLERITELLAQRRG